MLDHVHRSQKALVKVSRCDIKMSTFAMKFKADTYESQKSKIQKWLKQKRCTRTHLDVLNFLYFIGKRVFETKKRKKKS